MALCACVGLRPPAKAGRAPAAQPASSSKIRCLRRSFILVVAASRAKRQALLRRRQSAAGQLLRLAYRVRDSQIIRFRRKQKPGRPAPAFFGRVWNQSPACLAARSPTKGTLNIWLLYAFTIKNIQQAMEPSQIRKNSGAVITRENPWLMAPRIPDRMP